MSLNYFQGKIYKLFLYSQTRTLSAELTPYINTFSFGEKVNDFVDCNITLNINGLPKGILDLFETNCLLKIIRKGELVWSGINEEKPDFSINNINQKVHNFTFKHIGKNFGENTYIFKNYNIPTDEGAIFTDIIEYSQTAANWNTRFGTSLTDSKVFYKITTGVVDLTGVVKVFDFSKKETKVIDAVKQIIKAKEGGTENRYFKITPSFLYPSEGQALFKTGNFGYAQEVFMEYFSPDSLSTFGRKTDILDFKKEAVKNYNFVLGKGDGGLQSVAVSGSYLNSVNPIRMSVASFKDVVEQANLDDLTQKKLEVLETPPDIYAVEIIPNSQFIGKFSAGQFIKIKIGVENQILENVNKWFFVLEINISFDNLTGIEKMTIKIAEKEPNEINPSGIVAMLESIKGIGKRLNILES